MFRKSLLSCAVGLGVFLAVTASFAVGSCSCLGIAQSDPLPCSSTNPPCKGSYVISYCDYGCSYGECFNTGIGNCCGTRYNTVNIDRSNCNGDHFRCPCGSARKRSSSANAAASHPSAMQAGASKASPYDFRSEEHVVLVPDRCRHTYAIVYPLGYDPRSSARAAEVRVQNNGGGSQ